MHKCLLVLAASLTLLSAGPLACVPSYAADESAKASSAAPDAAAAADNAATVPVKAKGHGKGKGMHKGKGHHGRIPDKKQVMGLSDLTAEQKTKLSAVYDAKKAEWAELRQKLQAVKADEWQQVQGILTPAQIDALGNGGSAPAADNNLPAQ